MELHVRRRELCVSGLDSMTLFCTGLRTRRSGGWLSFAIGLCGTYRCRRFGAAKILEALTYVVAPA
jgi:hypothetical protein